MQLALGLESPNAEPVRTPLTGGAWVDHLPGFVQDTPEDFQRLLAGVPWREQERQMYDRVVAVPRLTAWCSDPAVIPHPGIVQAFHRLNDIYGPEYGEPFTTAGLCLYRDGADSVAWHGDTIGRGAQTDTVVAIISLGAGRKLMLRPRQGGPSLAFEVLHGDLLAMGGSCQRTWEHAVPKTRRQVGPRISVQFRMAGVA